MWPFKSFLLCFIAFLFFDAAFPGRLYSQEHIHLKPGPDEGKDAFVWDYMPDNNYGNSKEFTIYAWTMSGIPMIRRCYIDFDISAIPCDATIINAQLILYNDPNSPSCYGAHSQLSGPNCMKVERVVSPWQEDRITWTKQASVSPQNAIIMPPSCDPHQHYQINITELLKDMIQEPETSHGFRLSLQTEEYYRSLIFASSDIEDTSLRPEIIIDYFPEAVQELELQPGPAPGKDAIVWDLLPSHSGGCSTEFTIYAWTNEGMPSIRRAFIDFDFSSFPSNAVLFYALLSLYNDPASPSCNGEHSQISGSNEMLINRVISPWEEGSICWNNQPEITSQNETITAPSKFPHQHYYIDITRLAEDILNDPMGSYGLSMRLLCEEYYRSLIFASSDIENVNMRPKLELFYTIPTGCQSLGFTEPHPNPFTDKIYLDPQIETGPFFISLYDIYGHVFDISHRWDGHSFILTDIPQGVYFLHIQKGEKQSTYKLIKQ